MTSQLIVRVDTQLKDQVALLARQEGKNSSEVIRDLMSEYVQTRDPAAYIDGLWERIGRKVRAKVKRPQDIQKLIRSVRKQRRTSPKQHA